MKNLLSLTKSLTLVFLMLCSLMVTAQVTKTIDEIKNIYAPDNNLAIWEIKAYNKNGVWELTGKTDKEKGVEALENELKKKGIKYTSKIQILPYNVKEEWALVALPQEYMRRDPANKYELLTQPLMGTPLRILETDGDWVRAQTPDNYIAWIKTYAIKFMTPEQMDQWRETKRYIVTAPFSNLYATSALNSDETVTNLILGNILTGNDDRKGNIKLYTPDGRSGYIPATDVAILDNWAAQSFNPQLIVSTAHKMMGSTYLWGGNTTYGVDCSGLTKMSYFANGIILQRDAYQQAQHGIKISPKDWKTAQIGDLIYFGNSNGRITHTAIYIGNGKFIHSSGKVKINNLDPAAGEYTKDSFKSLNRINGAIDTDGIISVKNHPWYYNHF